MSFDLAHPGTLVMLIPDELRVAGRPASTPDEVLAVIASLMYAEGDCQIIGHDDPDMIHAVAKTRAEVGMVGGGIPDSDLGPLTIRFKVGNRTLIRHVRVLVVKPGAMPKIQWIDFRNPGRYGLMDIGADTDEADKKIADLERRVLQWQTRSGEHADERDEQQQLAEAAGRKAADLQNACAGLADRLERFTVDAIVVVPMNEETLHETLRRRVQELEQLVERIRGELVEPAILQRRRATLELANRGLRGALQVVLAAATEGRALLPATSRLRFLADIARGALADSSKRFQTPAEEATTPNISDWASAAASFCALLAQKTGSPHGDDCDCQGCAAHALLEQAEAMHIIWTDPTTAVLDGEGATT